MQTHNGEKQLACTICGKNFEKNQHLKLHLFLHSREKNFKCKVCYFSGDSRRDLHHHMTSVHDEEKPQEVKVEDVYSGMGFMFEEETKVEEDIKKEVEDINMKLKVEVEEVIIGKVEIEDLKEGEALLVENNFEGELLDTVDVIEHAGDLLLLEKERDGKETIVDGSAKLCNLSMACQREDLDFCQETFDACFLRTVALAESNQRRERELKEKMCVWV